MNELIKVNYDTEHPTVSSRDLHDSENDRGKTNSPVFPRPRESMEHPRADNGKRLKDGRKDH